MDNKTKLLEGTIEMNIYTNTIKEIIDSIEKKFDICLKNTDLELRSVYSSYAESLQTK
jgi:hypothetical protein